MTPFGRGSHPLDVEKTERRENGGIGQAADCRRQARWLDHAWLAGVGYVLSMRATIVMTITATPATMKKKTICGTV